MEKVLTRREILVIGGKVFFATAAGSFLLPPGEVMALDWQNLFSTKPKGGKALVQEVTGKAEANRVRLKKGDTISSGAQITVAKEGNLILGLPDGGITCIRGKAGVKMELAPDKGGIFNVLLGTFMSIIPRKDRNEYLVKGPTATIGIKGTVFFRQVFNKEEKETGLSEGNSVPSGVSDYFCTCNGTVDYLQPGNREVIQSDSAHHHSAFFLSKKGGQVAASPAGMMNHSDQGIANLIKMMRGSHDDSWLVL